jgi:hypothetical protein
MNIQEIEKADDTQIELTSGTYNCLRLLEPNMPNGEYTANIMFPSNFKPKTVQGWTLWDIYLASWNIHFTVEKHNPINPYLHKKLQKLAKKYRTTLAEPVTSNENNQIIVSFQDCHHAFKGQTVEEIELNWRLRIEKESASAGIQTETLSSILTKHPCGSSIRCHLTKQAIMLEFEKWNTYFITEKDTADCLKTCQTREQLIQYLVEVG